MLFTAKQVPVLLMLCNTMCMFPEAVVWVAGVVKRVAGLLVAGLVLGTVLFYVGLRLAFPDYT